MTKGALLVVLVLHFVVAARSLVHPHAASFTPLHVVATNRTSVFDVAKTCGAAGDGKSDDTSAVKKCIYLAEQQTNAVLYFPAGKYFISQTLTFDSPNWMEIRGDGWTTTLLHSFDADLFLWENEVTELVITNLRIESVKSNKNRRTTVMHFAAGVVRSIISQILVTPGDANVGSGILMEGVVDSVTINDCQLWRITGTGVEIGHGSEVRLHNGRIIGNTDSGRSDGSIGVHVTGNNGGVHIDSTDIITLTTAILLDASNGYGPNREVFLTHATLDSCGTGLAINDSNVYVSVAGLWAASSDINQIWVAPGLGSPGPILVVSGGTIFNGGAYGCADPSVSCNGITVNSGQFTLSGVEIRNNLGRAVWVPNNSVAHYIIVGCHLFGNGQAFQVTGSDYMIGNNVCNNNNMDSIFSGSGQVIVNNIACN